MSTPLLAQTEWVALAKETTAPTATVTLNQTPATVTVASTTGFDTAGSFLIWAAGVVTPVFYTGLTGTTFTGATIAAGSVSVTTASLIYGPQGTAVTTPTVWIPVTSADGEDLRERVRDESYDGDANTLRGVYDGQQDATFSFDGLAYGDTIGHVLAAAGLADTISGAGPYVHTLKFPALAGAHQPPSYTIFHYQSRSGLIRAYAGCILDTFSLKAGAKGGVTYSASFKGWKSSAATDVAASLSTVAPFLAYQNAITIGGVASDRLLEYELSVQRSTEGIHTQTGLATPSRVFAGPRDASIKSKFLFSDMTDINHFLNNDQVAVVATMTQPSSGPILALTATKTAWMKTPAPKPSGQYLAIDAELDCISNTTDQGPFAAVLTNSVSTAF